MICGKSPPSGYILETMKSNISLVPLFKKGEMIFDKIELCYIFPRNLKKHSQICLILSIRLKCTFYRRKGKISQNYPI